MARLGLSLAGLLLVMELGTGQSTSFPAADTSPPVKIPVVMEHLLSFDPLRVELKNVQSRWQLWTGDILLKDFGSHEAIGRQSLRLIQMLHLTQRGVIGAPRPIAEYWLSSGRAPLGKPEGLRLQSFDPAKLRVEEVRGQWCVRDERQAWFALGLQEQEARLLLETIRHHGFDGMAQVGQPPAAMTVFTKAIYRREPGTIAVPAIHDTHLVPSSIPKDEGVKKESAGPKVRLDFEVDQDQARDNPVPPTGATMATGEFKPIAEKRLFLNVGRLEVRGEKGQWMVGQGPHTLLAFGADERTARQAIQVARFHQFTELRSVGEPAAFTYYLRDGQAPRGVSYLMANASFQPDQLKVKRVGDIWVIEEGSRIVLTFVREADARMVLQIIQQHQFDRLCRLGPSFPAALTFPVRSR